jgi:hypothetical protein
VYGYLPSARVLREGGYETRGLYHGGIGYFAPEAKGFSSTKSATSRCGPGGRTERVEQEATKP